MRRALAVALFLVAGAARAQSAADVATARDLFREGMELRAANKLPEALAKLAAAHALYQTPASALELGRAQIDLGKLAEGYETLLSIERIPAANESARSKSARVEAAALAEKTKARIPTLRVDVSGAGEDTVVTLDGERVPPALFGVARKVDPGRHVVVARGAAGSERTVQVDVAEQQAAVASVEAPRDAPTGIIAPSPPRVAPQPFSVLYNFLPPTTTERWSLHARDGAPLCALPCQRWIGEHTGDYLVRAATADDPVPRRVDVPETLPGPIGSTMTARPHAGRGSLALSWIGGVSTSLGVLGLLGGVPTMIVGLIEYANQPAGNGVDALAVGGVMSAISVALLVPGILLSLHNYAASIEYTAAVTR